MNFMMAQELILRMPQGLNRWDVKENERHGFWSAHGRGFFLSEGFRDGDMMSRVVGLVGGGVRVYEGETGEGMRYRADYPLLTVAETIKGLQASGQHSDRYWEVVCEMERNAAA